MSYLPVNETKLGRWSCSSCEVKSGVCLRQRHRICAVILCLVLAFKHINEDRVVWDLEILDALALKRM